MLTLPYHNKPNISLKQFTHNTFQLKVCILTAVNLKILIFWDVTLCSLIQRCQHFREPVAPMVYDTMKSDRKIYLWNLLPLIYTEDAGSSFLKNAATYLPNYTSNPRRLIIIFRSTETYKVPLSSKV